MHRWPLALRLRRTVAPCQPTTAQPMTSLRYRIWGRCIRRIPEATPLPWWMITFRLLLFPATTAGALILRTHPFDPLTLTWNIHGTRFTDELLMAIAGQLGPYAFRFHRRPDGTVDVSRERRP